MGGIIARYPTYFTPRVLASTTQEESILRGTIGGKLRQGAVPEQMLAGVLHVPDASIR